MFMSLNLLHDFSLIVTFSRMFLLTIVFTKIISSLLQAKFHITVEKRNQYVPLRKKNININTWINMN